MPTTLHPWLPEGWRTKKYVRHSGNNSGKCYYHWHPPADFPKMIDGVETKSHYRSKTQVLSLEASVRGTAVGGVSTIPKKAPSPKRKEETKTTTGKKRKRKQDAAETRSSSSKAIQRSNQKSAKKVSKKLPRRASLCVVCRDGGTLVECDNCECPVYKPSSWCVRCIHSLNYGMIQSQDESDKWFCGHCLRKNSWPEIGDMSVLVKGKSTNKHPDVCSICGTDDKGVLHCKNCPKKICEECKGNLNLPHRQCFDCATQPNFGCVTEFTDTLDARCGLIVLKSTDNVRIEQPLWIDPHIHAMPPLPPGSAVPERRFPQYCFDATLFRNDISSLLEREPVPGAHLASLAQFCEQALSRESFDKVFGLIFSFGMSGSPRDRSNLTVWLNGHKNIVRCFFTHHYATTVFSCMGSRGFTSQRCHHCKTPWRVLRTRCLNCGADFTHFNGLVDNDATRSFIENPKSFETHAKRYIERISQLPGEEDKEVRMAMLSRNKILHYLHEIHCCCINKINPSDISDTGMVLFEVYQLAINLIDVDDSGEFFIDFFTQALLYLLNIAVSALQNHCNEGNAESNNTGDFQSLLNLFAKRLCLIVAEAEAEGKTAEKLKAECEAAEADNSVGAERLKAAEAKVAKLKVEAESSLKILFVVKQLKYVPNSKIKKQEPSNPFRDGRFETYKNDFSKPPVCFIPKLDGSSYRETGEPPLHQLQHRLNEYVDCCDDDWQWQMHNNITADTFTPWLSAAGDEEDRLRSNLDKLGLELFFMKLAHDIGIPCTGSRLTSLYYNIPRLRSYSDLGEIDIINFLSQIDRVYQFLMVMSDMGNCFLRAELFWEEFKFLHRNLPIAMNVYETVRDDSWKTEVMKLVGKLVFCIKLLQPPPGGHHGLKICASIRRAELCILCSDEEDGCNFFLASILGQALAPLSSTKKLKKEGYVYLGPPQIEGKPGRAGKTEGKRKQAGLPSFQMSKKRKQETNDEYTDALGEKYTGLGGGGGAVE